MEDKKLLLLDAYALIFRAYYAMMRNPRVTSTGLDTSAVFGFVNTLQELLGRHHPSHIAVCIDPGGKTFRHEAYDQYKANRDATPEGILVAVPYIERILAAYHIPVIRVSGYEADDVIGTLSRQAQQRGFLTYMVTGDKDFGQLVTDKVKIYNPSKGELMGVDEVNAKYGLQDPLQVIDILGLMGDTADNIPGCPGVGPKTAEKLVQQYGSVENLLAHSGELKGALKEKVETHADQIRFSKFLATIKTDVPITLNEEECALKAPDLEALRAIYTELEFRTFLSRLPATPTATPQAPQAPQAQPAPAGKSAKPTVAQVGSLFDMPPVEAPAASSAVAHVETPNDTFIPFTPRLIEDPDEAARLIAGWTSGDVGVHIVSEGDEAMRATIVGVALATPQREAVYLPCDGFGLMIQALAPLFGGKARLVSADVKRDMVMLHTHGIAYTAPYYDTAVAHYLLEPERGHTTREVAAQLLHHECMDGALIFGAAGKSRLKAHQVPATQLMPWACELAHATLCLPAVLDKAIEDQGLTHLNRDVEQPLVQVLAAMEMAGARIDVKALNEFGAALTQQIAVLDQECHALAGVTFNTASPMQVGEVLFERLKIDDKAKKTRSGQYSTTEEVLLKLRDRHPLVDKILELRGKRKLLSTYVTALPALINPVTGRIHTTFNQTVTATGRLSSANPNLQNIPVRSDEGREIRRAFIPSPGNVFFSADYSQIELRLVADLSKDKTMLEAFAADHDIHAITASRIYHEPLEQVTAEQRRRAKTANFGILYGISAFGLAQRLNIARSEAKELIDGYFATFPQVRAYIDHMVEQARQQGYVTTLYGRRRMLPDINSRNAVVRSFSERNAVNAPIQGTAADVIKMAMVAIYRRFTQEHLQSRMILQVHDELNFDVVPSELDRVQAIVIEEMERAYSGDVKLTASHGTASNWLDAH